MWNLRALLLLSLAIVTDATLAYAIKPGCEVQYQKDSQTCRSLNKDSAVKSAYQNRSEEPRWWWRGAEQPCRL